MNLEVFALKIYSIFHNAIGLVSYSVDVIGVLLLCWDTVDVFYSPNWLGYVCSSSKKCHLFPNFKPLKYVDQFIYLSSMEILLAAALSELLSLVS